MALQTPTAKTLSRTVSALRPPLSMLAAATGVMIALSLALSSPAAAMSGETHEDLKIELANGFVFKPYQSPG